MPRNHQLPLDRPMTCKDIEVCTMSGVNVYRPSVVPYGVMFMEKKNPTTPHEVMYLTITHISGVVHRHKLSVAHLALLTQRDEYRLALDSLNRAITRQADLEVVKDVGRTCIGMVKELLKGRKAEYQEIVQGTPDLAQMTRILAKDAAPVPQPTESYQPMLDLTPSQEQTRATAAQKLSIALGLPVEVVMVEKNTPTQAKGA